MKAIAYTKYGSPDVLKMKEVEKPIPSDDEILIKIYAVSINRSDWEGLIGKPLYSRFGGLFRPSKNILGSDIAGRVEAVGKNNKNFQVGDEVFGDVLSNLGGFAEYVCVRGTVMALKPKAMSYETASTLPQAGIIALKAMRDTAKIQLGQKILINGAGGSTGVFAIQLAKLYGAEVTAVDNGTKLDFMRSIGADHVIDYTLEDFTKNSKQYDFILDLISYRSAFNYPRALTPNGSYYMVGGSVAVILQILFLGGLIKKFTGKNVRVLMVFPTRKDLESVAELCEAGKLIPSIEQQYPLSGVPEALRRLGEGNAKGKLVIKVAA